MLLRVQGYLSRMEQLKAAGYGRRRVSRHSSTGSGDGGRQGPRGMIEGAGTLNASGASDAPSSPEPVDPGFTHSIFKAANAYVLEAVRDEGGGDLRRAFNSYSRAISEFIRGTCSCRSPCSHQDLPNVVLVFFVWLTLCKALICRPRKNPRHTAVQGRKGRRP